MSSIMDMSDTMVINTGLKLFRGFIIPKDDKEKKIIIPETRYKIAEYYYEKMKTDLKKKKKVNEKEFIQIKKDLDDASKHLFK